MPYALPLSRLGQHLLYESGGCKYANPFAIGVDLLGFGLLRSTITEWDSM
ncbi:hypothetical protein PS662_01605 [Pseudomonas fluorescens]|uniref:Uncharacterized protein n=1 Tax=Pseudomonas fluorescens TaxID=294 RepID=A0A5E6RDM6_PSEFL|nr:hypothetical protein PS662_01605 [Pseudomonas fluorescens]